MSDKAVEQAIAEQEKRERNTDRREILRPAPGEKPKMKAFQVFKKGVRRVYGRRKVCFQNCGRCAWKVSYRHCVPDQP